MNKKQVIAKARACDLMIEIIALLLTPDEPNRLEAAELIRKLDAEARRDLRAALQTAENLLDDVILAEMKERRPWRL
jgi:hypothetical protein